MNWQDLELIPNLPPQNAQGPDWDEIGRALTILSEQIPRIAHWHNNFQNQTNALLNGLNQTVDHMNELDRRITAMEQRATRIEADLTVLPMRLLNGISNNAARIEYPPPHVPGGALPATKVDAWRVNGVEALAALQALGVSNIPDTEAERVRPFLDYIGLTDPLR